MKDPSNDDRTMQQKMTEGMEITEQVKTTGEGSPSEVTGGIPGKKKLSNKGKLILAAAGTILILAGIILTVWMVKTGKTGRSPEKTAACFIEALQQRNPDAMYELLSPEYVRYMNHEGSLFGMTVEKDVADQLEYFYEDLEEFYEIGEVKELSCEKEDIQMVEYTGADLDEMKEYFTEAFDMEITAFTQANLDIRARGSEAEKNVTVELYLFCRDHEWYYIDWYWD